MMPNLEFVKKYTALEILNNKKKLLPSQIVDTYIDELRQTDDNLLDSVHRCEISLTNINISLVNTLRRIVLSYIPTVALDNINIQLNNTSLINEFIEKRLQLISLNMQTHNKFGENYNINSDRILNSLQLKSYYNKMLGIRRYDFIEDKLPKFSLRRHQTSGINYITSSNITISNEIQKDIQKECLEKIQEKQCVNTDMEECNKCIEDNEEELSKHCPPKILKSYCAPIKYFNQNQFTNDYDIITKLKESEEINIEMGISAGIGFNNTIYSPVGTIAVKPIYIHKLEDIDELLVKLAGNVDDKSLTLINQLGLEKQLYIESYKSYKNSIINERIEKGLLEENDRENPFDSEETGNIKHDFDTLIRPRIYPNNNNNTSTSYLINIETNGNFKAEQLFLDALSVLYINIRDIEDNIKSNKPITYKENECIKISITQNHSNKYELLIENENHTIGNILINYLNLYNDGLVDDKLDFISYTQPHPLKNKIVFKFITELGSKTIFKVLQAVLKLIMKHVEILANQYLDVLKTQFKYESIDVKIYPSYLPEFLSYASFRLEL